MATLTLKKSGYLAAATAIAWTAPTQDFDSLTDNEWCSLSDEIDNSTNKYGFVDLYFDLGSAAFTGDDSAIEAYLVPSVDGTNYPTWTDNATTDEPQNNIHYVDRVVTTGSTAVQDLVIRNIQLPDGKYKWGFRNVSNVTLSATNTVYWRPHSWITE